MNEKEAAAGLSPTPGYRYADVVGNQLFVAGQVPLDAAGVLVGDSDPTVQTLQCLANLMRLIELHGFDESDVRQLTIHVVGHQADLTTSWAAVADHFEGSVPPATLLGASSLGYPGQLVEIDAIIVRV
ncbi:MAG: RidA family protein [Acidimicrobiia bacterium]|nr:RidA family protein [Acidimicrobiia bacterium]